MKVVLLCLFFGIKSFRPLVGIEVGVMRVANNRTVVNNESSEIIRMFNTAFNAFLSKEQAELNYYPELLQKEIDETNEWIYDTVNNGVYKSGFATTQQACKSKAS